MNSRAKGKRIELEACKALRALGLTVQRTQQYQGSGSNGDIEVAGTVLHVEVKGREEIATLRWMDQADRDKRADAIPMVMMRENAGEFHIMLKIEELPRLFEEWLSGQSYTHERSKTQGA